MKIRTVAGGKSFPQVADDVRWAEGRNQATPASIHQRIPSGLRGELDGEALLAEVKEPLRVDRFDDVFGKPGAAGLLGGFANMLTPRKEIEAAGVVNVGERARLLELAHETSTPGAVIQEATKGLGTRADFEKTLNESERAHFIQNFPTVGLSESTMLLHRPSDPREHNSPDRLFKELNLGGISSRLLKDWTRTAPAVKATIDELIDAAAAKYGSTAADLAKNAAVVRVGNAFEDYGYAVLLAGPVTTIPDGMPDGTYRHETAAVISPEGKMLGEPVGGLWSGR